MFLAFLEYLLLLRTFGSIVHVILIVNYMYHFYCINTNEIPGELASHVKKIHILLNVTVHI